MLINRYTTSSTAGLSFDQAVERTREELKAEGFGVLCEIDVQATLREKLGVEGEPYLILGACNPPLAHRALEIEPQLGTLLPCNVVVYERRGETQSACSRLSAITSSSRWQPRSADVSVRWSIEPSRAR